MDSLTNAPELQEFFGEHGGCFVPEPLVEIMRDIGDAYHEARKDPKYLEELRSLFKHYVGRPSPVFFAENLSRAQGGASIYLKREDLNHTGAHKINNCLGQVLLAKRMGKKKVIAETGAGQHGVALATAAAHFGMECDIYMGEVDIEKEYPNVIRMKILGARVVPVSFGLKTLKEAVDAAFQAYVQDPVSQFYAIGSAVGPYPFPAMVREFHKIIGEEARTQMQEMTGKLPDHLVASVGGGSNAIGLFTAFLEDSAVRLWGVEPAGRGPAKGDHASTITYGTPGVLHGFRSYLLQEEDGSASPVYSIASGLDYPGVGPQHAYLKDTGRAQYVSASDEEAVDAFFRLSREEGIIPALESAHAIAYALKLAVEQGPGRTILVNLSGRGDKDIDYVARTWGKKYGV
jgi:tryptophan synthase beta chain